MVEDRTCPKLVINTLGGFDHMPFQSQASVQLRLNLNVVLLGPSLAALAPHYPQ